MASVTLLVRAALALVFIVAGTGKLTNRVATRDTIIAFGVPWRIAGRAATLLPAVELLAALGLLVQQSSRWGALLAAVLLLVFIAGIGYALGQGRRPECNCFGQLSSARIGASTVARNAALLALALLVVWKAPGSSLSSWSSDLPAANLVAALALLAALLLAVLVLQLRQLAGSGPADHADPSAAQPPALLPGSPAPAFALRDLNGVEHSLATLTGRGLPLVLVFASPSCLPCRALMPELARWNDAMGDSITFAVIESGVAEPADPAGYAASGAVTTLLEPERELALAYSISATPTAVVIAPDGRVATAPATGGGAIENLVRETVRIAAQPLVPSVQ